MVGPRRYEEGLQELARAQASGFEDKEALKRASQAFFDAQCCSPNDMGAFVALGYLLLLLADHDHARKYLEHAINWQGNEEDTQKNAQAKDDALKMLEFMNGGGGDDDK